MRPAPWFALFNPSTLLFLSFLYTHSLAVVIVNSVVTPSGSSTIHQNDQIVVSWSAEKSDPPTFDINLRTSDGRLILLMPNVSSQRPKRATMPVNNAPAPAVYTIAMSVNGKPLDTRGPSFIIEPGPGQAPTTNSPTPTNQPPPPTRSPTSPSTSTSSNIIVVTELTTTITEAVTAPLPTATSKSMEGVSPTPVESSAVSSDMPTIIYTSLFTNSDGYVVTTTIFPGSEPTSTTSQSGGSHKSSAGAIAGGVIGAFVLIGLIVAGVFWYRRRRRNRMAPSQMFRFLSRHQGSDTQNSPLHMHQTTYSGVNRTYEGSDASGPPPPLYSNINAWLGKVRPA